MTELQKLNVKDFVDRIIYLDAQARVCRECAPVKLVPMFDTTIHVRELKDFMAIQELYKVADSEIEINDNREDSLPSVNYCFYIKKAVKVLYIALKGNEGFDLPRKEVANE